MSSPLPDACPIARHPAPVARVDRLVRMVVERPDLWKVARFFGDFGLKADGPPAGGALHLRGAGPDVLYSAIEGPGARLLGLTFAAAPAAVSRLAASGWSVVEGAARPAFWRGREVVRCTGPLGLVIEVVADARESPAGHVETSSDTPIETPDVAAPRINEPIRLEHAPPAVRHLGHVALEAVDFDGAVGWFTEQLGLVPSDVQVLDDGSPALAFLRCDRGPEPAEHHAVVIARSVEDGLNHAAFAVDDLDAVAMGQTVMRAAGWRHAWGVGRHLMGSQIFDYWYDPWGALVEHYADSDRFDAEQPPGVLRMSRGSIAQWGPPMPERFVNARLTPRRLLAIARGLRTEPTLTLKRLLLLRRALTND